MNNSRHSGGGRNPVNKLMLLAFVLTTASAWNERINAAELGRLFYTPQQRVQLETQQITGQKLESEKGESGNKASHITVNGIIQKQGGKRIVWINGRAQAMERGNEKAPASVPVTVPGKSQPIQIQVGQRLMLDTMEPRKPAEAKPAKAAPITPNADEDD